MQTIASKPDFGENRRDFRYRAVQGDFNATSDARQFTFDGSGDLHVYKGGSFGLWQPDTGEYFATANSATIIEASAQKRFVQFRNSRSAFSELPLETIQDESTLPMLNPRIGFADITNQSNSRTVIAALLPPRIVLTHKAPYLLRIAGSPSTDAFLLGVLTSIPLDWFARRYVEKTLSFEILNSFPVPTYAPSDPRCARVVEVAGRLAAVDQRYSSWASDVGVTVGTAVDEGTRTTLIAELDALVSLLYGLTGDQIEHVFATFHRGWDYTARLERVLAYYEQWKDAA